MREIRIEKVVLNMGCGEDKDRLKGGAKLLEKISGKKPAITKTRKRTTFGMAKKRDIGVKVTMRGQDAERFLKELFEAADNKIREKQIGDGTFSVGVKEYIDLPKIKYDPDIGILGFDVCVALERPGFRVKRRGFSSKIGKNHLIRKSDVRGWLEKFGVSAVE